MTARIVDKTVSALGSVSHEFDVCVIGGGMAGLCAAIASARNGARTVLIHDRPVFGGNASSEIRMWICGAHGEFNKETGLLEEIQLENQYRNPGLNYSVWDSVLYGKAAYQPNLTPLLNCTCTDAEMDGDRIVAVRAWQMTSQTWHTVHAKYFIDCSGDSILAALTPAAFRVGRESRYEFDEDIEPETADSKTMGNTLLLQLRRTDEPQPYIPPTWAYKFTSPSDLPNRIEGVNAANFWWLEIGGLQNTIDDAEAIRDELMRIAYGVWDYIKNYAPERSKSEYWALEWVGSLPGKRENRRYVGDHVLTQNDISAGGNFDDIIAYGGWTMDDHHPAGLFYPGSPTIFHPAPSPYGIPFRSIFSANVPNLLFAGRNISTTHAALSSTRVMATCSLLGQAAGTAAAICQRRGVDPSSLSSGEGLAELQSTLMDDDCWLPGRLRGAGSLALTAKLSTSGNGLDRVLNGMERDRVGQVNAWTGAPLDTVEYRWSQPTYIGGARLVFDSNLNHEKRMPCSYPQRGVDSRVPSSLVKRYRIETLDTNGSWQPVHSEQNNYQRLATVTVDRRSIGLRFVPEETWGDAEVRLFSFEPVAELPTKIPTVSEGPHFSAVRAKVAAVDLEPPDSTAKNPSRRRQSA